MAKKNYYPRFGKRLAARDGGYFCRYCGSPLAPNNSCHDETYWIHTPVSYGDFIDGVWVKMWVISKCTPRPPYKQGSVDHVVPRCDGGTDDLDNLVLCCIDCNRKKHTRDLSEWQVR